jgi:hypothetical protein
VFEVCLAIHHYTLHRGVDILTSHGSYWSMVRMWKQRITVTRHHCSKPPEMRSSRLHSTPLHFASWQGYPNVIWFFLEHGAEAGSLDGDHDTPLHLAAYQGKLAAAQLLMKRHQVDILTLYDSY